jgi:uncharacterized protein (DUF1778 family)
MSTISLRLPTSLHNAAREIAKLEHVSINQFIMLAVAEKVSVLGAEDIIRERAKHGSKKKFLSVLKNAPNIEPDKQDKL